MKPFRQKVLANGLLIEIFDETNRYFGGYHRVCLRVVTTFDLQTPAATGSDDAAFWEEVRSVFGSRLQVSKNLIRMAVPGAAVKQTASDLSDEFFRAADDYMARPDYPKNLARSELAGRQRNMKFY